MNQPRPTNQNNQSKAERQIQNLALVDEVDEFWRELKLPVFNVDELNRRCEDQGSIPSGSPTY